VALAISLPAEKIAQIGSFPVTNSVLTSWIVTAIFIIGALVISRQNKAVPGKFQNAVEMIVEGLFDFTSQIIGSASATKKYFPLLGTLFVFIIFNNWIGLLPGVGSIGFWGQHHGQTVLIPLFRGANADLNMTIALSLISVTFIHWYGISALGIGSHLGKFFNFKDVIGSFVGLLELISEFSKIISFAFRLFGNIFAGEKSCHTKTVAKKSKLVT
jgi:F-type H+-transporting ATPase subunit a